VDDLQPGRGLVHIVLFFLLAVAISAYAARVAFNDFTKRDK
jgi:hypothetical protein